MLESYPKLMSDTKTQTQEAHKTPNPPKQNSAKLTLQLSLKNEEE